MTKAQFALRRTRGSRAKASLTLGPLSDDEMNDARDAGLKD